MKIRKITLPLCAAALLAVSCYDFAGQTTVMSSTPTWTGSAAHTYSGRQGVVGLAGQDVYWFNTGGPSYWHDPLIQEFGGPYVLTSVTQTHTLGLHEQTFVHGNLVGETDNLSLLHTVQGGFGSMEWVDPWFFTPSIQDKNGTTLNIVEICDMASPADESYGNPSDPDSQLFLSVRACSPTLGGCAGAILEVSVDSGEQYWWTEYRDGSEQAWAHAGTGPFWTGPEWFTNECMPIAVTTRGDQSTQYLVVAEPSRDEVSLFDASSIASGPVDSFKANEPNRSIVDLTVEGRGDGEVDVMFLGTLWKGSAGSRLKHRNIADGDISTDPPFLVEVLPSNIDFIASRGVGAEGTTGDLFTFGAQVMRRNYAQ